MQSSPVPLLHMSGFPTYRDLASQNVPTVLLTRNNFRSARDTSEIWAVGTMRVIAWCRQLFGLLSQPGFFVVNCFRFARDMGTIAKARG